MSRKSKTTNFIKMNKKTLETSPLLGQIKILENMQYPELEEIVFGSTNKLEPVDENRITPELITKWAEFCTKEQIYGIPTIRTIEAIKEVFKDYNNEEIVEIGAGNGLFTKILGIKGIDNYSQKNSQINLYMRSMGQPPIKYTNKNIVKADAITYLKRNKGIKLVFGSYITDVDKNAMGIDDTKIFVNDVEKYLLFCSKSSHSDKKILNDDSFKKTMIATNLLTRNGMNGFLVLIEKI